MSCEDVVASIPPRETRLDVAGMSFDDRGTAYYGTGMLTRRQPLSSPIVRTSVYEGDVVLRAVSQPLPERRIRLRITTTTTFGVSFPGRPPPLPQTEISGLEIVSGSTLIPIAFQCHGKILYGTTNTSTRVLYAFVLPPPVG